MNMYDRLGLECRRTKGRFGVEIELEGFNLPKARLNYWNVAADGSLRGEDNAEYVLKKPMSFEESVEAINFLWTTFDQGNSRIDETYRAGVHVHLNIQHYTPTQLLTFITTYYCLEDHLVNWCGRSRVGNHFCLRACDAEFVIYRLLDACKKKDWRILNTEDLRYASLNLTSMFKYGSLEFRSMRSTKDKEPIIEWLSLINQLEKGAMKFGNPMEVITALSEMEGGDGWVRHVMEDSADHLLQFKNVSLYDSMRVVQPIAFMTNWGKFDKEKINPFI